MTDWAKTSRRDFLIASGLGALTVGCSKFLDFDTLNAAVKNKKDFPIVVIGAGTGGLTAAAYLSKFGFPVTVLEKHQVPGGYAGSFRRGRFEFEISLHQTAVKNTGTEKVLRETGLYDKLETVPCPELCRMITPDRDVTLENGNPEGYVETFSKLFPSEREGIARFVKMMGIVQKDLTELPHKLGFFDKLSFPRKYPEIWALRKKSLVQLLETYISSPQLISMISTFWGYYGLPPSKLSAMYYVIATGGYVHNGGYYYKPRSSALSDASVELIKEYGGNVLLGEEVLSIEFDGSKIKGVKTASGVSLPACAVVSNASGPVTFEKLVSPEVISSRYKSQLEKYSFSPSSFIVWLGLNKDVTSRVKTYEAFINEHTYDQELAYARSMQCDAEFAPMVVNIYDNLYKGYSEPGTNTVAILIVSGYKPWKKFEADYRAGNKDAYNNYKKTIADKLIARTEKTLIPGLSGVIETMVTSSPLTNVRFTGNPEGAIYGYNQSVDNTFDFRIANRTPVKGLYLASAWGYPGGGYTGVQYGARQTVLDMMDDFG